MPKTKTAAKSGAADEKMKSVRNKVIKKKTGPAEGGIKADEKAARRFKAGTIALREVKKY